MGLGKHHLLTLNQIKKLLDNCTNDNCDFESTSENILGVIQKSVNFDSAWIIRVSPESLNIQNIFLHQFSQDAFSRYLDDYYSRAPIPTLPQIKNEKFIAKKGSELIEEGLWATSAIYQEVILPLGLHFFVLSAFINANQEYIGYMVLWRKRDKNDFSSQDCFFLEKASAHIADILNQIKVDTNNGVGKSEVIHLVNQRSEPGVMILDQRNEMIFMNQEAKNILNIFKSGRAHLTNKDDEVFLQKLYSLKDNFFQFTQSSAKKFDLKDLYSVFIFRGTTYTCRAIPLEGNPLHERSVMILIETIKEDSHSLPLFNGNISEFTAREKAIAGLISQGLTNKEISADLGIGIHTVKDHVKNIMGKLGIRTRSGIVSKLSK